MIQAVYAVDWAKDNCFSFDIITPAATKTFQVEILHLPVYKSTFYSLKIGQKNRPQLIHGSKTEIKNSSGQIFFV